MDGTLVARASGAIKTLIDHKITDIEKCREYVLRLNPNKKIIPISSRTGEGVGEWADWLREQTRAWIEA